MAVLSDSTKLNRTVHSDFNSTLSSSDDSRESISFMNYYNLAEITINIHLRNVAYPLSINSSTRKSIVSGILSVMGE